MLAELAIDVLSHPWNLGNLRILATFRRIREELALEEADRIAERQYHRTAQRLGLEPRRVAEVVQHWMERRPLRHLPACRFPEVDRFLEQLRTKGKTLAVFSDYPARDKLAALGLEVDHCVSAVDPQVDRLKPHPRGVERALELAAVAPGEALLIGDRIDRDGECARRAAIRFLLLGSDRELAAGGFSDFATLVRSLSGGTA